MCAVLESKLLQLFLHWPYKWARMPGLSGDYSEMNISMDKLTFKLIHVISPELYQSWKDFVQVRFRGSCDQPADQCFGLHTTLTKPHEVKWIPDPPAGLCSHQPDYCGDVSSYSYWMHCCSWIMVTVRAMLLSLLSVSGFYSLFRCKASFNLSPFIFHTNS